MKRLELLLWRLDGSLDLTRPQQMCILVLQEVIVKICSGEGCSFAHDAVITAVRAFLHYALPWENQEVPDDMDSALAWVGSVSHTSQQLHRREGM